MAGFPASGLAQGSARPWARGRGHGTEITGKPETPLRRREGVPATPRAERPLPLGVPQDGVGPSRRWAHQLRPGKWVSHRHQLRTGQLCGHRHRLVRVRFAVGSGSSGAAPRPERRPLKCTRWFVSSVRAVTAWDLRTVSSPRGETPRPLATTLHPWRPSSLSASPGPPALHTRVHGIMLRGLCVWSVTAWDVLRFGCPGVVSGPCPEVGQGCAAGRDPTPCVCAPGYGCPRCFHV